MKWNSWFMHFLKHRVADKPLIGKWLKADIKEEAKLTKASTGINLGCVISPSLAYILHY
jgi:hypothetical protein